MRSVVVLAIALAAIRAAAGDFRLVVQRDPNACRDAYATVRAPAQEVADDLLSAFQGGEPRIRALRAIVMNASVGFCTPEDRRELERGLAKIGTQPHLVHERKYIDFVLMVATENLVNEIDARLGRKDLVPGARRRLEYLRDEAPRWITYRRTGRWPPKATP
jgi:hypothetical protein